MVTWMFYPVPDLGVPPFLPCRLTSFHLPTWWAYTTAVSKRADSSLNIKCRSDVLGQCSSYMYNRTVLITLFLRFWLVTCLFIILDDWAAECIPWHSIETRRICLIRNRICWPANAPWLGNMCQENVCQISMCKCSPMNSIVFTIFILDCSKPKLSIFRGLA